MISNSPDAQSIDCPLCGESMRSFPSGRAWCAPCEHCGQLLWFAPSAAIVAPVVDFDHLDLVKEAVSLAEPTQIASSVLWKVPRDIARQNRVFPISEWDASLVIAAGRRIDRETVDKVRFIVNRRILLVIVDDVTLRQQIDRHCGDDIDE